MTVDRAATRISKWMTVCKAIHDGACHRDGSVSGSSWTPTRLLKLSRNKLGVRLVETKGRHFRYTALSYCWGRAPTSLTKRWNYQTRLLFIPWIKIPRLHQDAIELTRSLDISYIWIDSFCIIQDKKEDWQRESALMADVYGSADLVISAAHAASVNERLVAEFRPKVIQNRLRTVNDQPREILAWPPISHKLAWSPPRGNIDWPMLMRAWTFQERLLSSRCVHFGPSELLWECSSLKACECGLLDRDPTQSIRHVLDELSKFSDPDPKEMVFAWSWTWMSLVRQFSGRKLSRETDRLVALAGLARRFDNGRLGRYLAGLWENDFLQGLMWMPHTDAPCYRPVDHVAPSWSWASVVGEVWYDIVDRAESMYHAKVVDVRRDSDIMCGPLTLKAPTISLEFAPDTSFPVRTDDMLLRSEWDLDIQFGKGDAELARGDKVICAFIFSFKSRYSKCAMALVLKQTSLSTLRRVGILKVFPWENTVFGMEGVRVWVGTLPDTTMVIE